MSDLFVYGTLRHVPLLESVLGKTVGPARSQPDSLPDHSVLISDNGLCPWLSPDQGRDACGDLVRDLNADDLDRLSFYAAVFSYDLLALSLSSGAKAQGFGLNAPAATGALWSFDDWKAQWAELACETAREIMDHFGQTAPDAVAKRLDRIRTRAWSRVLAKTSKHGAGVLAGDIQIAHRNRAYSGFYALDDLRLRHQAFAGGMGQSIDRAVFVPSDAALVLPYDPVTDRVLLVEQFRVGPLARGDKTVWQMEPVAGLIDPGEAPETTARREAMEEAGLELAELLPVAESYTSPGGSSDFQYLYIGLCSLPHQTTRIGGVADEGEDIRAHVFPFSDLLTWAETQTLANTPLALATYWLAHHRTRLRST